MGLRLYGGEVGCSGIIKEKLEVLFPVFLFLFVVYIFHCKGDAEAVDGGLLAGLRRLESDDVTDDLAFELNVGVGVVENKARFGTDFFLERLGGFYGQCGRRVVGIVDELLHIVGFVNIGVNADATEGIATGGGEHRDE